MKLLNTVLVFIMVSVFSAGMAWGECTQEEMEAKARKVAEKMEQLQQRNDTEYRFMLLRFNNKARLIEQNDTQAWCDLYDQMLFEL